MSDIEPFKTYGIPSNIFLSKNLPGCGATEREITFLRHSAILESNVPVIIGKCLNNKNILGVYEGITIDNIIEYLQSDIEFKKILVTPESFFKLKEAMEELEFDLYQDFFLLFDECEKIIQDVNYRRNITLPMDDFFLFANKAFVSATPILPSDPRFIEHGFEIIEIEPTFDHSQPLSLFITNNIFSTLSKFITEHLRDKYFIFFNTTDNIADFIKKFNIQNESLVLCAKDSRKKLKMNGFKNVSTEIKKFMKYNFFTSRFYSAVDINYDLFECDPTIIMVTDLIFALHSKIDPFTEAVQIQGRFRETKDKAFKREIVHITNIDNELTSMSRTEVDSYLNECHIVYKVIDRYFEGASSHTAKETLRQMLTRIDYAKFISLPKKTVDHFMVDNLISDEEVKGYYQSAEKLIDAYSKSKHFKVKGNIHHETYNYTDRNRLKARSKNLPLKNLKTILTETLIKLYAMRSSITEFEYNMELSNLQFDFPNQMVPINKYGMDNAEKLKFDVKLIEKELANDKLKNDQFGMMTYIQETFRSGAAYTTNEIKRLLKAGFGLNKIYGVNPSVNYLRTFAFISDANNRVLMGKDKDGKEIRGYRVFRFKDNII